MSAKSRELHVRSAATLGGEVAVPGDKSISHRSVLLAALASACHDVHLEPRQGTDGIAIADDLFAVSVPSADHVVAAGYWGAIYVSRDAGTSWERGAVDVEGPIYDVSMADTERGFACGQRGLLLRTDDDAGAGGGGNRELGGAEPAEPEPGGGGLTSSGLSERYGDIRLFYALLVSRILCLQRQLMAFLQRLRCSLGLLVG